MTDKVTDLVGFRFDKLTKAWKAAFFIGALGVSPLQATAAEQSGHYELLGLSELQNREEAARKAEDPFAEREYRTAERAILETQQGLRATPNELPPEFDKELYTDVDGRLFKVIDPVRDVDWTEFQVAQKTARVKAELVVPGTVVDTIMANGLHETSKTAGPDGGYRVTAHTGEQYLVDKAKFEKLYDITDAEGVYAPKPSPRKVLPVGDRDVAFTAPWGEPMRIASGGVLVNGGKGDVYGIQPEEFKATYSFTPS